MFVRRPNGHLEERSCAEEFRRGVNVTKGQWLRTAERKIFDFVAINLTNFNERLDQAVTRGVNGATYSSQSRILVSNRRRIQFNLSIAASFSLLT